MFNPEIVDRNLDYLDKQRAFYRSLFAESFNGNALGRGVSGVVNFRFTPEGEVVYCGNLPPKNDVNISAYFTVVGCDVQHYLRWLRGGIIPKPSISDVIVYTPDPVRLAETDLPEGTKSNLDETVSKLNEAWQDGFTKWATQRKR